MDASFGQVTVTPLNTTTYELTTNSTGNGSVVRVPDKAVYLENEAVKLTAIPDNGWLFKEWQGDVPPGNTDVTLTLTMTGDKIVTAIFEKAPEHTLTVSVTGQGAVSKTPDQISYMKGMTVTLTAMPDAGWIFREWQGDVPSGSMDPALTLPMDGDKIVTAIFEKTPEYTLAVNVMGQGAVNQMPDQLSYTEGMTVTLTAVPESGWVFKEWQGDVPADGTGTTMTLTMNEYKEITAVFEQKPRIVTIGATHARTCVLMPGGHSAAFKVSWSSCPFTHS